MSFHNTIALTGKTLLAAEQKATTQDALVLQFFRNNPNTEFTPCEVHQLLIADKKISPITPLTSIRRSITGLTDAEKIIKTSHRKQGVYGKLNYTWVFFKKTLFE